MLLPSVDLLCTGLELLLQSVDAVAPSFHGLQATLLEPVGTLLLIILNALRHQSNLSTVQLPSVLKKVF